jgi:hypothetical protein
MGEAPVRCDRVDTQVANQAVELEQLTPVWRDRDVDRTAISRRGYAVGVQQAELPIGRLRVALPRRSKRFDPAIGVKHHRRRALRSRSALWPERPVSVRPWAGPRDYASDSKVHPPMETRPQLSW